MVELNRDQQRLIEIFAGTSLVKKFYWTGGTALSVVYLHHRLSIDLDFFSEKTFFFEELNEFIDIVKKDFNLKELPVTKIFDRWQFNIGVKNPVKIEFVYFNHEKKRLRPVRDYRGIMVDSLEDIAANKTLAYFDRNEPKDLFDLYFLINKAGFSVKTLLQMVKEKFGIVFSEFGFWSESAKGIELLDSLQPLILDKNPQRLVEQIKTFFLEEGKNFLSRDIE
jgi:predicted nucleotidyltransferase component of viral defense system